MLTQICSIESPGSFISTVLFAYKTLRKVFIRHLCLPRPSLYAVKAVEDVSGTSTGLYNFHQMSLQPWYVKPTFWSTWSLPALLFRAFGGRAPGSKGDRYHPQGYNLWTIGPKHQEGKGMEEMTATIEFMKARGLTGCPFPHK